MRLGSDIRNYIKQPGDRVVVVPNGTYTAGKVTAPHAATSGKYKGWLVLKAQSKGGVVVNSGPASLELDSKTSRVLFVGFTFRNGPVTVSGPDIAFWYTDHSFPADVWHTQQHEKYHSPDTLHVYSSSSVNDAFYGVDIHDTGDAIDVTSSVNLKLQGVKIWNLSDMGLDPSDKCHPDAIDAVGGRTKNLTVLDTWIKGRVMLIDANGAGTAGGPVQAAQFKDTWVSNSPSAGFTFTARKNAAPWGVFGTRTNVRSWGHNNGKDRIDIVDGRQYYTGNTKPSRVNVVDNGIIKSAPSDLSQNPADLWRLQHPYDNWMEAIR
jgi:hypothetical protein